MIHWKRWLLKCLKYGQWYLRSAVDADFALSVFLMYCSICHVKNFCKIWVNLSIWTNACISDCMGKYHFALCFIKESSYACPEAFPNVSNFAQLVSELRFFSYTLVEMFIRHSWLICTGLEYLFNLSMAFLNLKKFSKRLELLCLSHVYYFCMNPWLNHFAAHLHLRAR